MSNTFRALAGLAALLFSFHAFAQEKKEETPKKKGHAIVLSSHGVKVESTDSAKKVTEEKAPKTFSSSFALVDLGVNLIQDNTDYTAPAVKTFLNVPANMQNKSLFDLRPGKSINVNIYPWMIKFNALKTNGQRIFISTGIGLQLYNFRYESPLTYTKNPSSVIIDTIAFHKDKLALDYLNVPLMLTFKTRLHKKTWLVYGAGITEGFRVDSWTKQVSDKRGKVKVHDAFGLADFNTCVSAEFGIDGIFRFYASYQLTSLYDNGLDQHPVSFGLRFSGI